MTALVKAGAGAVVRAPRPGPSFALTRVTKGPSLETIALPPDSEVTAGHLVRVWSGTSALASVSANGGPAVYSSNIAGIQYSSAGVPTVPGAADSGSAHYKIRALTRSGLFEFDAGASMATDVYMHVTAVAPSSVAGEIEARVAGLLDGVPFSQATSPIYSAHNGNASALVATRNTANPLHGQVDLVAMSAARSDTGRYYPVYLLTPRHVLIATHTVFSIVGATVAWVGLDNTVYTAQCVRIATVPGLADLTIGYLSAPLPADVAPWSVLAAGWQSAFPYPTRKLRRFTNTQPAVRVFTRLMMRAGYEHIAWTGLGNWQNELQSAEAVVDQRYDPSTNLGSVAAPSAAAVYGVGPNAGTGYFGGGGAPNTWADYAIPGDSGSPVFAQLRGKTVLLMIYHGNFYGAPLAGSASTLNPVLNAVKDGSDTTSYAVAELIL